jgi:hypothetical protein
LPPLAARAICAARALDADACAGAWIVEMALHGAASSGSITRRARASIQTPDRASRCLTLVSEKRIIDLI